MAYPSDSNEVAIPNFPLNASLSSSPPANVATAGVTDSFAAENPFGFDQDFKSDSEAFEFSNSFNAINYSREWSDSFSFHDFMPDSLNQSKPAHPNKTEPIGSECTGPASSRGQQFPSSFNVDPEMTSLHRLPGNRLSLPVNQKFSLITDPDDFHQKRAETHRLQPDEDEQESASSSPSKTCRCKSMKTDDADSVSSRKERKSSTASSNQDAKEVKREKFLERNRVAASKCRQKKKQWTNDLQHQARELTSERTNLTTYVASLKDEVLSLKDEMLKHDRCGCTKIRDYLHQEASMLSPTACRQHWSQGFGPVLDSRRKSTSAVDTAGSFTKGSDFTEHSPSTSTRQNNLPSLSPSQSEQDYKSMLMDDVISQKRNHRSSFTRN